MRKCSGFTLMEILVVLLIIALLVSLTLPVLNSVRRHSQQTTCVSNMRQIHVAWTLYIGDYGGSVSDTSSWPPYWRPLTAYVIDERVLVCPSDPQGGWMKRILGEPTTSYPYLVPFYAEKILRVDANP